MFLPQGGNSPYLEHIADVLRGIRDGVEFGTAMFAAFDALGLIQPMKLDVRTGRAASRQRERPARHRPRKAGRAGRARRCIACNRAGYLEGAYLVLASLHNMRRLMAEKQRRLREQDSGAGKARH